MQENATWRPIEIIADDRERTAAVIAHLQSVADVVVTIGRLRLGDYVVDQRLLFERKSQVDLPASIVDGRRQLVGFERLKSDLDALGVKVVAASVDLIDKAREVAAEVSFPVGYGVTCELADKLGAWWEGRRSIIQPAEFVLGADGKVIASSYSDGPIGRIDAADVIKMIHHREAQLRK